MFIFIHLVFFAQCLPRLSKYYFGHQFKSVYQILIKFTQIVNIVDTVI